MNRLRAIAIEERRQLITFGFAVAVFLMTLLAFQLHGRGQTLNRVNNANRDSASRATHEYGEVSPGNRAVALAAVPAIIKDSNARN
jgi:hypothetical protein